MGLIVGTALAPDIPNARQLRTKSIENMYMELSRQILPDGVGAEQSPSYAAFTIEMLLTARLFMN